MDEQVKKHKTIEQTAVSFSSLLLLGYFCSLVAPLLYFFDLFSHFTLQYIIGGVILGLTLAFYKRWIWCSLVLTVALLCFIESRWNLEFPMQFSAPKGEAVYKIAAFNHNFGSIAYDHIEKWIKQQSDDLDAIILLEANEKTKEIAVNLSKEYPFQLHEPRDHAFGMVILSKYKMIEAERIDFNSLPNNNFIWDNFAIRFTIKDPEANAPLAIYAMHPPPPGGPRLWEQRNGEMQIIGRKVMSDPTKNKIVLGDLNNTPFSPSFREFLKASDLNIQSYGFLLNPTWPSFFFAPIFQIPIDHVLYSGNLIQQNKYVGPAIFSDHHAIIAEFSERP